MFEVVRNPSDADFWAEALRSKYFGEGRKFGREDYDGILGDFQVRSKEILVIFLTNKHRRALTCRPQPSCQS
jgi:hypothetical protein